MKPGTATYRITCTASLTSSEATEIRNKIIDCLAGGYHTIYLDTKAVNNTDLSGINEVINSAYVISNTNTRFILVYTKGSVMEKWIDTTGLDKFVYTALIPQV